MVATMQDVARLAGVSIKTVSNVVNGYPHIRESTRGRVLDAIAQLDYQPNVSARRLRSGRAGAIGLALPDLSLPYFAQLAGELIKAAEGRGQAVLIEQTNGDRGREIALLDSPRMRFIDGLIFSPLGMDSSDAGAVGTRIPTVLLGERIFGASADHVTMRNVEAAAAATRHLLDIGRRRIAVVGVHPGEVVGSAGLRLSGHLSALEEAGIAPDPSLFAKAGLWHRADGAAAMRDLLESGVRFDAVFAFNDTLALGAMRVLQGRGVGIPDDVAIIGFDDLDESRYSLPSLSTVDPGRREIAHTAVDLLLERIGKGSDPGPHRLVESRFTVMQRESTGAPVSGID